MKKIVIILSCVLLTCCDNTNSEANTKAGESNNTVAANPSPSSVTPVSSQSHDHGAEGESNYKPNFIKAADLLQKLNNNEKIYIFDVRDQNSYNESHIKGAFLKSLPITPAAVMGMPKDSKIVTYCGCPHHLSSIGAEQLSNMGYKDVHVLDEGFWHWRDHKYPLDKSSTTKVSELIVSGNLMKDNQPVVGKDIYLKHMKSGQLEATRTDDKGYYKMTFHIYDYKNKDDFKFYVEDLKKPIQDFSTDKKETNNIVVTMK